ncbi:MAG: 4-phosphopantetheinyl transferase family protein [Ekhidna sp.]|nr:4-phosphopantetheinyl transferase family protein [Ekhidna sp.]
MPLLLSKQIDEVSAYAVWNIQETFLKLPYMSPEPFPTDLNLVRQSEWIVGRILAKSLSEKFNINFKGIGKHETGKPYLIESDANISISHSFPIASGMIHLEKSCGIDIEHPGKNYLKVQKKFINESEKKYKYDLMSLCAIWCAKEVIYKIFGRRFLSFKDEINISFESDTVMRGEITKKGHEETHRIHYEWVRGYLLAYGI